MLLNNKDREWKCCKYVSSIDRMERARGKILEPYKWHRPPYYGPAVVPVRRQVTMFNR